jgi:hypothetical protein
VHPHWLLEHSLPQQIQVKDTRGFMRLLNYTRLV